MLVVMTETYCNEVSIQITQGDDFIQLAYVTLNSFIPTHWLAYVFFVGVCNFDAYSL